MDQEYQRLIKAKEFFESIGIMCYDIVLPIDSDVYCVKRTDNQWAAFRVGNPNPIVPFGKYWHMWGFDGGFCLVSVRDEDKTTFANRGIINEKGIEVIEPYTFKNIWKFYGSEEPYIITHVEDKMIKLDRKMLELL